MLAVTFGSDDTVDETLLVVFDDPARAATPTPIATMTMITITAIASVDIAILFLSTDIIVQCPKGCSVIYAKTKIVPRYDIVKINPIARGGVYLDE